MASWNPFTMLADIQRTVHAINTKAGQLMSQQDDLTADVAAITQAVTDLGTAAAAIENEIAALKAGNPALDLSGLDSAVASLKTSVDATTVVTTATTLVIAIGDVYATQQALPPRPTRR